MPTIILPGRTTAGDRNYNAQYNQSIAQSGVRFPLPADGVRRNNRGLYVVKINSIDVDGFLEGEAVAYINYNGITYEGGNLEFSSLTNGFCQIRVYLDISGTNTDFGLGQFGDVPGAELYNVNQTMLRQSPNNYISLANTFNQALAGSWSWNTVPTPPSINLNLSGTSVTVTRGTSTSDNIDPVRLYGLQRRESTDGTNWGSWSDGFGRSDSQSLETTTFSFTYTNLISGKYYQFRVFSYNNAGASEFTTSGILFVKSLARNTGTGFTALDKLKRYDGSAWQNITQAKRWNGTSWVTIDVSGINST